MDVFGVGPEGETYTLKIGGFQPYFFVRLPDGTSETQAKDIVRFLQESNYFLSNSMKNEFNTSASRLEPYFAYHGYQFGKKHPFLKLVFHSDRARKRMARQMEKGCKVPKGMQSAEKDVKGAKNNVKGTKTMSTLQKTMRNGLNS